MPDRSALSAWLAGATDPARRARARPCTSRASHGCGCCMHEAGHVRGRSTPRADDAWRRSLAVGAVEVLRAGGDNGWLLVGHRVEAGAPLRRGMTCESSISGVRGARFALTTRRGLGFCTPTPRNRSPSDARGRRSLLAGAARGSSALANSRSHGWCWASSRDSHATPTSAEPMGAARSRARASSAMRAGSRAGSSDATHQPPSN
jgi:hypothetical protein